MKKLILLFPLALLCMGTDQCPLINSSSDAAEESPPGDSDTLNLGGAQGALWRVAFEPEILVTLGADGEAFSQTVQLSEGQFTLQGQTIDVANFCWRTDTICPHQVLPQETMIIQSEQSPRHILIGFNRQGPLSFLNKYVGLNGQIDGRALSIPLAVGEAGQGQCGLGQTSAILATALSVENDDLDAMFIQGRIALTYTGLCFNLGGSAAMENAMSLELSMKFTAERQP